MWGLVGSIAGPAIEFLRQSVISLCAEEINLIPNFEKDLNELRESLEIVQAFLNDAEKKLVTGDAVKRWLRNLEGVAFDAGNVLDELNYEVHRRKMEPGNKLMKKVTGLFSTRNMGHEIRSINERLHSINQEATRYGLQSQFSAWVPGFASEITLPERETASNPDPFVVGREHYVSSVVEILTTRDDGQEVFSVIPIVGMGGLGKTTLAKSVFHDEKIKAHFKERIWVYVSQSFDEMALLKKILESLPQSSNDDSKISKDALLRKLQENLKDKKYLLILDDVWTEDTKKWDDFIEILSSITSVKGNDIVVTSRSENVASIVGTTRIEKLKGLTDEDCWSIIKQKAFRKQCDIPLCFEGIGNKIASKCQGLPLAARVVGGVLRGKLIAEWCSIEQDELSKLGDEGNTMEKILKLSFDNLPHQSLKKCFAFCTIFPKGYKIEKSMLIHLWMAEGFLQSDDMETLGDKYFDLLLHNSLLQVGEQFYHSSTKYTMHDLVCDLALSVLKESGPVRYIYLTSITDIPKGEARNVRSLIFEGEISDDNMLSDFKYLRALVLTKFVNRKIPKIEHLIHLRYLDILSTLIECSPMLVGNLYLLETFRAKVASNRLHEALKKLINLRHVDVEGIEEREDETQLGPEVVASPSSATSCFPNLKTLTIWQMHGSSFLENLLVNVTSLTKLSLIQLRGLVGLPDMFFNNNQYLRHLIISDCGNLTHMPPRFGVSIREVLIYECRALEGLPENAHCLEKLKIEFCHNIKSIPYNPSGGGSPSLRKLIISNCDGLIELPIGLFESCSSLLEYVCLGGIRKCNEYGHGNCLSSENASSHIFGR